MIRFSKYLWIYIMISSMVIVPGIISLVRFGLKPSIDFTGGTVIETRFTQKVTEESIRDAGSKSDVEIAGIQMSPSSYIVRLKPSTEENVGKFRSDLVLLSTPSGTIVRQEAVGSILGGELLKKTFIAAILAIAVILFYVAYAFHNVKFGVSAVVALIHDLLVVLGVFSLLGSWYGVEVDTLFVTAFLTTMSFSVHDTIVVFDRIREYLKRGEHSSFTDICDYALTETLNRSLTNSLTIVFMLLALILLGGENMRWFVVALLVGTISGTYSSPFVATPVLILWDRWEKRRKRV